jgi:hypothetical protein
MTRRALDPDLTPKEAARTLGLQSADELGPALKAYRACGIPAPDPDPVTGRFDPVAWERFRRLRNPSLFPELTSATTARDPAAAARERKGRKCGVGR